MGKRLAIGIVKGLTLGVCFGLLAIQLGMSALAGFFSYLLVALTGLCVGLVAGRPVWARDAKVEATLKAVVGAIAAAALFFVLQRWLNLSVDLNALGAGSGKLFELPLVALPLIALPLALLFELDDAVRGSAKTSAPDAKLRVMQDASIREDEALEDDLEQAEADVSRRHKR